MIAKALEKVNALTAEKNPKKCPELQVGDIVRVSVRIKEGDKERVQVFAGDVIARDGRGITETFTVRRPFASPAIEKIEVTGHAKVRRAKLYYLRSRTGKAARLRAL